MNEKGQNKMRHLLGEGGESWMKMKGYLAPQGTREPVKSQFKAVLQFSCRKSPQCYEINDYLFYSSLQSKERDSTATVRDHMGMFKTFFSSARLVWALFFSLTFQ